MGSFGQNLGIILDLSESIADLETKLLQDEAILYSYLSNISTFIKLLKLFAGGDLLFLIVKYLKCISSVVYIICIVW